MKWLVSWLYLSGLFMSALYLAVGNETNEAACDAMPNTCLAMIVMWPLVPPVTVYIVATE